MSGETNNIRAFNFENINIPLPIEPYYNTAGERYVYYGEDNLYPLFLLSLYSNSPIHQAIINSKATYLIGDGFKYANGQDVTNLMVNAVDSVNQFINRLIKDYLIFGYFCVEVVYNAFNQPIEYHHVPAHKVRTNRDKTKFWYSSDWILYRAGQQQYDRFTDNPQDSTTKMFFFEGNIPSEQHVYPAPEYKACIKSISNNIAIIDFDENNIKNSFSPSTLITFFQGSNISEEVKRAIKRDLEKNASGENGKKIIIDFQQTDGKSAEVKQLSDVSAWADTYINLQPSIVEYILAGHQVSNSELMGVQKNGQWQSNSGLQLQTAYEIFLNTYGLNKRAEILSGINLLFKNSPIVTQPLIGSNRALFQTTLSDALMQQTYTINEIRKLGGLPPLPNGDKLLSDNKAAPDKPNSFDETPVVSDDVKKNSIIQLSEDDFEKIKHLGTSIDEFESVLDSDEYVLVRLQFDRQSDIADWVIKNDISNLTLAEIRNELEKQTGISITIDELNTTLNDLQDAGVIRVNKNDDRIDIKPNKTAQLPKSRKVETMYQYEVRPGLGAPIIKHSRGFCRKLIENNRLYTRSEIQEMGAIFGYDIMAYAGGFYHNPNTGETTPYCRHQFKQKVVTRKNN